MKNKWKNEGICETKKNNWIITTEFLDNIKNKTHGILGIETKTTNIIISCEKKLGRKGGGRKTQLFSQIRKTGNWTAIQRMYAQLY